MPGVKEFYYSNFIYNDIGHVTGSTTSHQFPDVYGAAVMFKAHSDNVGPFFIDDVSGTTVTGWEVEAGGQTDIFPLANYNLDNLYYTGCSGSTDQLTYWVFR